jgi:hypothetical protein
MDRRKFNKGTKGNKGGRKKKADELTMIENMDKALAPQKVWERLANLVEEQDTQAIKLWMNYRYGMPKQTSDVNVSQVEVDFRE